METPYGEIPDQFVKDMSPQEMHDYLKKRYGRRTVLKGAGVVGAAAAVGPIIWKQSSAYATGVPIPQWISFGPDPTTSMYVSWSSGSYNTPSTAPAPQVRYGLSSNYGSIATATAGTVPVPANPPYGSQPSGNVDDTLYIHTLITGLTPGTTYHYSVSYDGINWGPDTTFTTDIPGVHNYRFAACGDEATSTTSTQPVAAAIAALSPPPVFTLVAGDLSYASGGVAALGDQYGASAGNTTQGSYSPSAWDSFFAILGPTVAQNIPFYWGVGNHEMEPLTNDGYAGVLTRFPQNYATNSGGPVNQTYTHGNVAFIQLDGNDLSSEIANNNGYTNGQQTTWLTGLLQQYRAAGSGIDFIVVYFHNCMFCSNQTHGSDGGVRTVWEPIFDQYQVDLVINGHVHAYERTYPIYNGTPTAVVASGGTVNQSATPYGTGAAGNGTTYICAGNAGQSLYTNWYGPSGGGDVNATAGGGQPGTVSSSGPLVWQWSGGGTSKGGSGTASDVADTTTHYSAYRHANWGFIYVDVVAPTSSNLTTSLNVTAVSPSAVVTSSDGAVIDSVIIERTTSIAPANLPEVGHAALYIGGAAAVGGAYLAAKKYSRRGTPVAD
jgi:hypothetical protein